MTEINVRHADLATDRDLWIRAFNRLDAAINHHRRDTAHLTSDADDRLYAARDRIVSEFRA